MPATLFGLPPSSEASGLLFRHVALPVTVLPETRRASVAVLLVTVRSLPTVTPSIPKPEGPKKPVNAVLPEKTRL